MNSLKYYFCLLLFIAAAVFHIMYANVDEFQTATNLALSQRPALTGLFSSGETQSFDHLFTFVYAAVAFVAIFNYSNLHAQQPKKVKL